MRKAPEDFEGSELELVYIAKKLKDALRLEALLTGRGIDYVVEPDHYVGGILFRTERIGAFFYVEPEAGEAAKAVLIENGMRPAQRALPES